MLLPDNSADTKKLYLILLIIQKFVCYNLYTWTHDFFEQIDPE